MYLLPPSHAPCPCPDFLTFLRHCIKCTNYFITYVKNCYAKYLVNLQKKNPANNGAQESVEDIFCLAN